jgi:hypothetical protein
MQSAECKMQSSDENQYVRLSTDRNEHGYRNGTIYKEAMKTGNEQETQNEHRYSKTGKEDRNGRGKEFSPRTTRNWLPKPATRWVPQVELFARAKRGREPGTMHGL